MEHDLLGETKGVVAFAVKLLGREAAEVTDAWQRERQQAVGELPHPPAAQGDMRPDRHALPQLELRNGFAGPGDDGLLPGDRRQIANRAFDQLGVASRLPDAHVHHDLDQTRSLHHVRDLELFPQGRDDLFPVALLEPGKVVP